MILSFSAPEMLPYIRNGIVQAKGVSVGGARVKRQTIRREGEQSRRVLKLLDDRGAFPYRLHLYWKSRAPDREFLGVFEPECAKAAPILIEHVVTRREPPFIRIVALGATSVFSEDNWPNKTFSDFSYADGFDSPEAFRDYFVPNPGDVFKGIVYRW